MEQQYYTPELEDLRVGYECEVFVERNYKSIKLNDRTGLQVSIDLIQIGIHDIRTPYLTKEQIEKEGWKIIHEETKPLPYKMEWIVGAKNQFRIYINLALHDRMNLAVEEFKQTKMFQGKCPSINEFRTIMKLLNIK